MADTQTPPPESGWIKLWKNLMGKSTLDTAAAVGQSPRPVNPPANQDISVVRKAAEEAGRRMEEEKASQSPPRQPTPAKYGCGGVVSRYGRYPS